MASFSVESLRSVLRSHFMRRPPTTVLAELRSGPLGRRQTSCEFAPWGIRWGRAGLLRLLAHAPTPSASMPPYQQWCPIRLAGGVSHRTRLRAELVLPLAQSVGRGASGPTQPPRPRGDRGFSYQTMSLQGHAPTRLMFPVALDGRGSTQTMRGHSKSGLGTSLELSQPPLVRPHPSYHS